MLINLWEVLFTEVAGKKLVPGLAAAIQL